MTWDRCLVAVLIVGIVAWRVQAPDPNLLVSLAGAVAGGLGLLYLLRVKR